MGMGTYVSAIAGTPLATGTQADPVSTIGAAMDHAKNLNNGQPVFVGMGTYSENLVVNESVSLMGGYRCDMDTCDWERNPEVFSSVLRATDREGLFVGGSVTRATVVDGFEIRALDDPADDELGAAVTLRGGMPTISNNLIIAPDMICTGNCTGTAIVVEETSDPAQGGALIADNAIITAVTSADAYGIFISDSGAADVERNDIRSGAGAFAASLAAKNASGASFNGNVVHAPACQPGNNTSGIGIKHRRQQRHHQRQQRQYRPGPRWRLRLVPADALPWDPPRRQQCGRHQQHRRRRQRRALGGAVDRVDKPAERRLLDQRQHLRWWRRHER